MKIRPCKGIEKSMEQEGNNYTNCDRCFWHSNLRIVKGTGGVGSWQTSVDIQTTALLRTARIHRKKVLET